MSLDTIKKDLDKALEVANLKEIDRFNILSDNLKKAFGSEVEVICVLIQRHAYEVLKRANIKPHEEIEIKSKEITTKEAKEKIIKLLQKNQNLNK